MGRGMHGAAVVPGGPLVVVEVVRGAVDELLPEVTGCEVEDVGMDVVVDELLVVGKGVVDELLLVVGGIGVVLEVDGTGLVGLELDNAISDALAGNMVNVALRVLPVLFDHAVSKSLKKVSEVIDSSTSPNVPFGGVLI